MIATLFGILIVILPFVGVLYYKDRLKAFVYIFVLEVLISLFLAIVLQYFAIFSYKLTLGLHLFLLSAWFCFLFKKRKFIRLPSFKINWFILIGFLIPFLLLLSIHYRYTGIADSILGPKMVEKSFYPYPFYSDEWVGVSLINYSIESGNLPMANPLFENQRFPNYLFGLHSFLAYLFLLLNISPLTSYTFFAILNTTLVSVCIYLILRLLKIRSFVALIPAISIVFITNSGNLPGFWNLLPYNASLTLLLFAIIAFLLKEKLLLLSSLIVSFLFYPPMLVFIVPLLVGIAFSAQKEGDMELCRSIKRLLFTCLILGIFIFWHFDLFSLILRERLDPGIVSYQIWNILPIFLLPFVCVGVWKLFRERMYVLLFPVIFGLSFWVLYIFIGFVIAIEQSRVVSVSAVLLTLAAGVGVERVWVYIKKKHKGIFDRGTTNILKILTITFFILCSVFCPRMGLWHRLKLVVDDGGVKSHLTPAPPVTRYLTSDDLRLFGNIKKEKFIAPPWKGLVIGTATNNFPLESKSSTISNSYLTYSEFTEADCDLKELYAKKFSIRYVYTTVFSCDSFERVGEGREGLVLYKHII